MVVVWAQERLAAVEMAEDATAKAVVALEVEVLAVEVRAVAG